MLRQLRWFADFSRSKRKTWETLWSVSVFDNWETNATTTNCHCVVESGTTGTGPLRLCKMKYYNNCLFLSVRIGQATCWWSAVASSQPTNYLSNIMLSLLGISPELHYPWYLRKKVIQVLPSRVNSFQEDAGATNKKRQNTSLLRFFVVGFGSGRQGLHHSNRRSNQYWTRPKQMNVWMTGRSHGEDWCFFLHGF